jgi:cytochrome c oxidase cbb3-type subunit 3
MSRPSLPVLPAGVWWLAGVVALVMVMATIWPNAPEPILLPPYVDGASEQELRQLVHDPAVVQAGHRLFLDNCTLCHGVHGEGLVGPNLRDDYWLGGSDMLSIIACIADGRPSRGMLAWRTSMSPDKIRALAAFVASLSGTEDGTGKHAEGTRQPITWR